MSRTRLHEPGAWTLGGHFLALGVLSVLLVPLVAVRMIVTPVAELVIRTTDAVHDLLVERLNR